VRQAGKLPRGKSAASRTTSLVVCNPRCNDTCVSDSDAVNISDVFIAVYDVLTVTECSVLYMTCNCLVFSSKFILVECL